ncbi:MAG: FAD:protein FMN transferase [Candidatus Saccharibacteria bacterium]|nr:FAD:protein FMN transferase [Pseudorhodobacter sp.]
MPILTRRRFLTLSAVGLALPARAAQITQWHGTALGAEAAIYLSHPAADAIIARCVAEIDRLESVFSLYRAGSALSVLNAAGRLDLPPFELLECLALCVRVHSATGGLFDPTIQPLWQLYATSFAAGQAPTPDQIAALLPRVGLRRVAFDEQVVVMPAGMALTLNGVAQGFIADKVAALLAAEGLTDILINTGEFHALGGMPGAAGWPVKLVTGGEVVLQARALATSSPLGTVFDAAGKVGHILNPATGLPAAPVWTSVSVSAASAAVADAMSTAACLMPDRAALLAALSGFSDARIEALV